MKKLLAVILLIAIVFGVYLLVDKLSEPNINRFEEKQDVSALIEALSHSDRDVRNQAKNALVRIGTPAVEELILNLKDNGDHNSLNNTIIILGEIGDERAIVPISKLLYDDSYAISAAAARVLSSFGNEGLPLLIDAMSNLSNRAPITKALREIGKPAVVSIIGLLDHEDAGVKKDAISLLGEIGDERAIIPISNLLYDDNYAVSAAAARALSNFGDEGLSLLVDAMSNLSDRSPITEVLRDIGKPAVIPVIGLLDNEDAGVKMDAVWLLEEIGDPSAEEALISVLDDEDLVFSAADLIVSFHDEDVSVLFPYLQDKSTLEVYRVLIHYGNPIAIEPLIQALETYGGEKMAEDFLNCGNEELEAAAKTWANENGYMVFSYSTPINMGDKWGAK